tara:strand:- start:3227 stop:3877 length:651 start_codon:yes stop_codon:yes gene_type:complete
MKKFIIGFDFDGTLFLSNEIKKKAFFLTTSKYNNGEIIIEKVLNNNQILNRYELFDLFAKEYRKEFPDSNLIDPKLLSNNYSEICFKHITQFIKPRAGMFEILEYLLEKKIVCYLISATPINDLKKIIYKLNLNKYFKDIFGAPQTKESLIRKIIVKERMNKDHFYYVGDDIKDYEASKVVGCNFIPIADDNKFINLNGTSINNLSDLINIFEGII